MVERIIRVKIIGEETVAPAADKASKSLGGLEKAAAGFITVALAKKAAQAANEMVHLGAQSLMARDRLNAFAGGSANAAVMVDTLIKSSDGVIDRLTATEKAARLLQMGVVDTAADMGMAGAIVGKLGDQTLTLETRMQTFTMMMANQSKLRLDTFGLSVERVTARQKALEEQGYSTEDAFKTAVFEEAEVALDKLGDTSESVATRIGRAEAAWKDFKAATAEAVVESEAFGAILEDIDWRTAQMGLQATQREMLRLGILTQAEVDLTNEQLQSITGLIATRKEQEAQIKAIEAVMEDYTNAITANAAAEELAAKVHGRTVGEVVEYHYRAARAIETEAEALDYLDAAQAKVILSAQTAARRRAEQLEDFARRAEDLERTHQETIAGIIASGQQSAASIAREAYQERLMVLNAALQAEESALRQSQQARAVALNAAQQAESSALREAQQARMTTLNEAMQAELAALAEGIAQRNFQASLESMEQRHRDRIQSIRDSAIESEESAENRRFKGVMDRLNEEQQARMDALRARYGKGEDADSQRESLEEEHRRRMMGLYTESARERERKRYEDALKELAFKEEEAALLEDFQDEKADAEGKHRDELDSIRRDDIQRQLDEENKRYSDAVSEAHRRQALRARDAAARNAITERYAAERAAREAQNRAEREAQDAAHDAARAAQAASHNAAREAQEASHNAQRVALAAQLKAQLDTIRQAEIAQRIADERTAYARQQEDLNRSRSRAETTFQESQARMRIATIAHWYEMGLITAAGAQAMYEAALHPGTVGGDRPWERGHHYARGTSYHPGGLAIVGDAGPELLDLPVGTRVTPMSQIDASGGGITIQNYFGADAVRSERDIYRIAENQEKAFRLRGVRTL